MVAAEAAGIGIVAPTAVAMRVADASLRKPRRESPLPRAASDKADDDSVRAKNDDIETCGPNASESCKQPKMAIVAEDTSIIVDGVFNTYLGLSPSTPFGVPGGNISIDYFERIGLLFFHSLSCDSQPATLKK